MSLRRIPFLFSALVLTAACSKEPAASKGDEGHAGTAPALGGVTAEPGSYDDWCGEHQVPESACTLCDPSLVAAFKATGDWCAEHGLPESQCLKCNPDLKIVRPPKPGGQ
jgi:hypothetical protein